MSFVIHSNNYEAYVALKKICKAEKSRLVFLQGTNGKTALLEHIDSLFLGEAYGIQNCSDVLQELQEREICENGIEDLKAAFNVFLIDEVTELDDFDEELLQNYVDDLLCNDKIVCMAGQRVSPSMHEWFLKRHTQFLAVYPPEPYELVEITQRLLNEADLTCTKSFIKGIVAQIGCSIGEAEAAVDLLTAYAKKENIKRFDSYLDIDDVAYELIYDEEANEADAAEINNASPMPMSIHELLDWEQQLFEQDLPIEELLQMRIDLEKRFVKLDLEKAATEINYDIFIKIYFIGKLVEERVRTSEREVLDDSLSY